jgi:hypothetical protein
MNLRHKEKAVVLKILETSPPKGGSSPFVSALKAMEVSLSSCSLSLQIQMSYIGITIESTISTLKLAGTTAPHPSLLYSADMMSKSSRIPHAIGRLSPGIHGMC